MVGATGGADAAGGAEAVGRSAATDEGDGDASGDEPASVSAVLACASRGGSIRLWATSCARGRAPRSAPPCRGPRRIVPSKASIATAATARVRAVLRLRVPAPLRITPPRD